jgi:hypothetical protein
LIRIARSAILHLINAKVGLIEVAPIQSIMLVGGRKICETKGPVANDYKTLTQFGKDLWRLKRLSGKIEYLRAILRYERW